MSDNKSCEECPHFDSLNDNCDIEHNPVNCKFQKDEVKEEIKGEEAKDCEECVKYNTTLCRESICRNTMLGMKDFKEYQGRGEAKEKKECSKKMRDYVIDTLIPEESKQDWEERFDKLLEDNAFEDYLDSELNKQDKEFMPKTIKSFIKSLLSEKDSYILHIENVKEKMRVCIEKKDKEISELKAEIDAFRKEAVREYDNELFNLSLAIDYPLNGEGFQRFVNFMKNQRKQALKKFGIDS